MVDVFGNEIIGAYTNGVAVQAIYANGVLVWPTSSSYSYYVKWDSGYYTGTFSMNGTTYSYESYYPSNYFSSPDFSGTITQSAFRSGLFSYIETNAVSTGNSPFRNCSNLETALLPECTYLGGATFNGCNKLSIVSLPVCSYIGRLAFGNCDEISSISLPECTFVGEMAFYDCDGLINVSLPKCSYLDSQAFDGCNKLRSIRLPECLYIGNYAFLNCYSLSQISLPKCSYIGYGAFQECSSLYSISLSKCSYIDNYAFFECSRLRIITLKYSGICTLVSSNAFKSTYISSIYVPSLLVSYYRRASEWSYFAGIIRSIT